MVWTRLPRPISMHLAHLVIRDECEAKYSSSSLATKSNTPISSRSSHRLLAELGNFDAFYFHDLHANIKSEASFSGNLAKLISAFVASEAWNFKIHPINRWLIYQYWLKTDYRYMVQAHDSIHASVLPGPFTIQCGALLWQSGKTLLHPKHHLPLILVIQ